LTIVNIVYFYMYVYSFLGRTWGIDWLTCHKSMKYAGVIQFKLYLPRYARSQIPTYKLCLIVIRSKYATHIHHVFKNCLLRCARFAIRETPCIFYVFCTHENINVFISTDRLSFPNNKISIFTGRHPTSSIFNSISMLFLSLACNTLKYRSQKEKSRWNMQVLFSSYCTYLGMQDPKSQHINYV
jgi:hypothetical protein